MDKKLIKIKITEHLYLRILLIEDACQSYVAALNDKKRVQHMTSLQAETSIDDVQKYIQENYSNPAHLLFGVFDGAELLGTTRLHDIDHEGRTVYMGIFIFQDRPEYKGLGTKVIQALKEFSFNDLGLESVRAGIFSDNIPSVRAFTKAGFNIIGEDEYHGRLYQRWIAHKAS